MQEESTMLTNNANEVQELKEKEGDTLENAYMTDSQLTLSIFNPSYPSEAHDEIDLNYRTLQQVDFSSPEIISPDVDTDYYSEFLKSGSGSSFYFSTMLISKKWRV